MSATTDMADIPRPAAAAPAATRSVETVQFLRFVAAGMVLIAHVSFFVHHRVDTDVRILGEVAQGVALFFVISGFIMTVTASPHSGEPGFVRYFALSRLIRIVPLYWAVNAAKLLGFVLVPGMIAANPTVSNVVYSLLFLPAKNADGNIEAFYGVGWSLNFEMAFYALFALALLLGKRPTRFTIPILLAAGALSFLKTEAWPTAAYLLSPALFNFVWGILIGEWYLSGRKLPVPIAVALIAAGTAATFVPLAALQGLLVTKVHMGAIVLGFVALEDRIGQAIPKLLTFLGDASYSLYLTHPMVGVLSVVVLHKLAPWMPSSLIFVLTVLLCLVFSAASFIYFEKPITLWLRKRLLKRGKSVES
ncbi:acyltransferase family protein [Thetidibacter halocola]|uniref:Acyltransferase n=1 Tax=Thetidibacter halocola TaxID=2827239 RepID=A0A8J7WCB8_9RHOB|nr:acyltransferase [Thetidibacter halocola]MBS0124927.1 acyltransferase [Thetidibacter halocola]